MPKYMVERHLPGFTAAQLPSASALANASRAKWRKKAYPYAIWDQHSCPMRNDACAYSRGLPLRSYARPMNARVCHCSVSSKRRASHRMTSIEHLPGRSKGCRLAYGSPALTSETGHFSDMARCLP